MCVCRCNMCSIAPFNLSGALWRLQTRLLTQVHHYECVSDSSPVDVAGRPNHCTCIHLSHCRWRCNFLGTKMTQGYAWYVCSRTGKRSCLKITRFIHQIGVVMFLQIMYASTSKTEFIGGPDPTLTSQDEHWVVHNANCPVGCTMY